MCTMEHFALAESYCLIVAFYKKCEACVYLQIEELRFVLRAEVGDICADVCYYKSSFLADS